MSPRKSPVETAQPAKKHLIFLASSTPEKCRDYDHICEQKGLPISFRDIKELIEAFHSSKEETGKFKGNGLEKLREVGLSLIEILQNSDEILRRKCADYHIAYDPKRVHFATEDGGFYVPEDIWKAVDKEGIPQAILNRIAENKDNKGGGPGVETASVLSAVLGPQNFMERVLKAEQLVKAERAQRGDYSNAPVPVTEKTILTLNPFKTEHTRPPIEAKGHAVHYLHKPGDPSRSTDRISTMHYTRPKDRFSQSCADLGSEFITHYSARSKTVDDLAKQLKIHRIEKQRHDVPVSSKAPVPFMLGVLPQSGDDCTPHNYLNESLKRKNGLANPYNIVFPNNGDMPAQEQLTTRRLLGDMEKIVALSDGFVLMPDEIADPGKEKQFEKFYTLFSLAVAKQLVARDMQKPIVILNHDGSWNDAIANHKALVNMGMTKDYNLAWPEKLEGLPKGAKIESNSYFDVIHAKNYDDSLLAGLLLLNKKRERYQRRDAMAATEEIELEGGIAPDDKRAKDLFKVAIFCSAGNENVRLNDNVEKLSYELSKNKFGIVYGAGDRYTMGAVLNGVVKHRQELTESGMTEKDARANAYVAGISTAPILVSETEKGQFSPELSYYKQTKNIYDRMADMLDHSNALVVAPGGAGTLQEWVAPLMIRKIAPQLFKDKPIVIYNPSLFSKKHGVHAREEKKTWDLALKTLLGETDYKLLTSEPVNGEEHARRYRRSKELGIYVETKVEHVQQRMESFREQWIDRIERERIRPAATAGLRAAL